MEARLALWVLIQTSLKISERTKYAKKVVNFLFAVKKKLKKRIIKKIS